MIGNASKLLNYPDRLQAFWNGDPVIPITLDIQPSNKCNQHCKYCTAKHNEVIMTENMLLDILKQASELGVEGISVCGGGEPLLGHIELFNKTSIPCGLITNGAVKVSSDIFDYFQWVKFSIDSVSPNIYESIRGVPLPICLFENITSSTRQTYTGVQAIVTEENRSNLVSLAKWAKRQNVNYLQIRPDENNRTIWISNQEQEVIKMQETEKFKVIIRQDRAEYSMPPKCVFGNFHMSITVEGECWICTCSWPRFKVGDLRESSLSNIIYSTKRQDVLRNADTSLCPSGCKGLAVNHILATCLEHRQWI